MRNAQSTAKHASDMRVIPSKSCTSRPMRYFSAVIVFLLSMLISVELIAGEEIRPIELGQISCDIHDINFDGARLLQRQTCRYRAARPRPCSCAAQACAGTWPGTCAA